MLATDYFYMLILTEQQKKYFSEAIERMGWTEYQMGFWSGGRSTIPDDKGNCLFYSENYTTERLYHRLQMDKEIPTDEEILNESRSKKLNEIL